MSSGSGPGIEGAARVILAPSWMIKKFQSFDVNDFFFSDFSIRVIDVDDFSWCDPFWS